MAGALNTEIRSALIELQDLLGEDSVFLWKNATVACVASTEMVGSVVVMGGHERVVSLALNVLKSVFLTADTTLIFADSTLYTADNSGLVPVAGRFLTYRGRDYRILTAGMDSSGAYYKLVLGDKHSGR